MAKKVVVKLIDDLDGSEAAESVVFGLDGVTYEVDLNESHARELRESLSRWIEVGRRTAGRRVAGGRPRAGASDAAKIRAWARDQGMDVSDRGRVSAEIREAYANAHRS